jgi:hypothetical protein
MYNFQSTFIFPTSHKLNAMTYGFIFLFQNNFEYIFLSTSKIVSFLNLILGGLLFCLFYFANTQEQL